MNQLNIHTDTHNLNELHKGVEAINQNKLNTHLFKGYIIDIYSFEPANEENIENLYL